MNRSHFSWAYPANKMLPKEASKSDKLSHKRKSRRWLKQNMECE